MVGTVKWGELQQFSSLTQYQSATKNINFILELKVKALKD